MLNNPIHVQEIRLKNGVFLAPLAGVSDPPFRRICSELGSSLTFVEMLAANAVMHGNNRTYRTMQRHPSEILLGVQVTGPSAPVITSAIKKLDRGRRIQPDLADTSV